MFIHVAAYLKFPLTPLYLSYFFLNSPRGVSESESAGLVHHRHASHRGPHHSAQEGIQKKCFLTTSGYCILPRGQAVFLLSPWCSSIVFTSLTFLLALFVINLKNYFPVVHPLINLFHSPLHFFFFFFFFLKQFMQWNETPLFLLLNPTPNMMGRDLPVKIYDSYVDIVEGQVSPPFLKSFSLSFAGYYRLICLYVCPLSIISLSIYTLSCCRCCCFYCCLSCLF
jgi:hypothetical protein